MANYIKALYGLYVPEKSEGQGMVEYGLILVLISVVVIALLTTVGDELQATFTEVVAGLQGGSGS